MVKFVYLTSDFYSDQINCPELLTKSERPFVRAVVDLNGTIFCVPLRSRITHPHVLWTDKQHKCGLDFSKTVVITDETRYIDTTRTPKIRQNEFDALRGKEFFIQQKLETYIRVYKKAKSAFRTPRNRLLVSKSTLQYFEHFL